MIVQDVKIFIQQITAVSKVPDGMRTLAMARLKMLAWFPYRGGRGETRPGNGF